MTPEQLQIVAAAVAITLGVVAIALSIVFYVLSNSIGKETKKAAEDAQRNLGAITELYERFYKDTFGMMRQSVSFVQDRLVAGTGPEDERRVEIEERVAEVEKRVEDGFDGVFRTLASQKELTEKDLAHLRSRVVDLATTAVRETAADEHEEMIKRAKAALREQTEPGYYSVEYLYEHMPPGARRSHLDAALEELQSDRVAEPLRGPGDRPFYKISSHRPVATEE